ncbi:MAG TPA: ATPase [Micromonosporaceae bacterium]|nr:ATPase [Micromonosporaceae bacterium]HCU50504.1 ATPase [Micromonosporaceae bacterium]
MTTTGTIPNISGKVTVAVPIERAFEVFTASFGTWWPADYHIGGADLANAILEPHEGGRWYEKGVDGSECDWGKVLAWEPPHRLVVTWQINGQWQYDPDPAHASEVEVRFIADDPGQTTVELEHRLLDRLVGGQAMHDAIGGAGGWGSVLQSYAKAVENEQ